MRENVKKEELGWDVGGKKGRGRRKKNTRQAYEEEKQLDTLKGGGKGENILYMERVSGMV